METLKIFINQCIRYAHHPYGEPKDFMQQAFGAVQFFMMEHPDQSNEAANLWEEVRPKFFEDWANGGITWSPKFPIDIL